MRELERYDLIVSDWKHQPRLDNSKNDFVSDLCERYLIDLRDKQLNAEWEGASYSSTVRKAI